MSKWQRIKGFVLYISAPLAFLCLPAAAFLSMSYTHSPRVSRPETGNVVPFNNHGTYVYITQLQDVLLKTAFAVGFAALLVTIVILVLSRRSKARG